MADSSDDSTNLTPAPRSVRGPAPSSGERAPISKGGPSSLSRTSVPPSEPRSTSRGSFSQLDLAAADRPARLQMIVALLLGLVLVAIPLYLWRRPRAVPGAVADAAAPPSPAAPADTAATDDKPTLGEASALLCQDPGPKKTSPEQCDHVVEVEKALATAIEESAGCITKEMGGGTVVYVADVSFKRKVVHVATPREGRSLKNAKALSACQSAVKARLSALALDTIKHEHARYKIAITATYPGPVR